MRTTYCLVFRLRCVELNHTPSLINLYSVLRKQSRDTKLKLYKKVGVLPIRIVKSNVSSVWPFVREKGLFLSDEGSTLETLDYSIRIGSTTTFLYISIFNSKS